MKTVLIITHEFPPFSGGFVMRALKFSKYLPEFGWLPLVLAAEPDDCYFGPGWGRDASLLQEMPPQSALVHAPSPLERCLRSIRQAVRRQPSPRPEPGVAPAAGGDLLGVSARGRSLGGFLRNFHVFQDQSGLWNPYAFSAALRLSRSQKIDAVLTTSPPHWVHLVGLRLKQKTGLPWVADFRDGWTCNPIFHARSAVRQRLDRSIEKRVVSNAEITLGVTPHIVEVFNRSYPDLSGRFRLLHNGFDPADFPPGPPSLPAGEVAYIHLGNVGGVRDPDPLLSAFQELVQAGLLQAGQACLSFVGQTYGLDAARFPGVRVELIPTVSHLKAVELMQSAGVLVLIAGIQEGEAAFTSKVFEYLAAHRPILAIIPSEGELNRLLSSYSLSILAPPDDPAQVRAAILRALEMASAPVTLTPADESLINRFNRRLQTGQLAALLDSLVLS